MIILGSSVAQQNKNRHCNHRNISSNLYSSISGCMNLDDLDDLPGIQFPHLKNMDNRTFFIGL